MELDIQNNKNQEVSEELSNHDQMGLVSLKNKINTLEKLIKEKKKNEEENFKGTNVVVE